MCQFDWSGCWKRKGLYNKKCNLICNQIVFVSFVTMLHKLWIFYSKLKLVKLFWMMMILRFQNLIKFVFRFNFSFFLSSHTWLLHGLEFANYWETNLSLIYRWWCLKFLKRPRWQSKWLYWIVCFYWSFVLLTFS